MSAMHGPFRLQAWAINPEDETMRIGPVISERIEIKSTRLCSSGKRRRDPGADDSVSSLPGIGKVFGKSLKQSGVRTIRDLARLSQDRDEVLKVVGNRMTQYRFNELISRAREIVNKQCPSISHGIDQRPAKRHKGGDDGHTQFTTPTTTPKRTTTNQYQTNAAPSDDTQLDKASPNVIGSAISSLPLTCSVHPNIKLDLYCQACNELVCGECFFDDDTHRKCTIGDGANTKPAVAKVSKCVEAVVNWQAMNPAEVSGLSVDRVHEDHSAIQQLIDELRDARLQLCRVEGELAVSQYQSCGGAAEEQAAALQRLITTILQVKHVKARCDAIAAGIIEKLI